MDSLGLLDNELNINGNASRELEDKFCRREVLEKCEESIGDLLLEWNRRIIESPPKNVNV